MCEGKWVMGEEWGVRSDNAIELFFLFLFKVNILNNQMIDSAKTFAKITQDLPSNRSVSMRVLRQGRASFITFKLSSWSIR